MTADEWKHGYSRERAAYPLPSLRQNKYWPPVARADNVYGDRNLFCTCWTPDPETGSDLPAKRPAPVPA